MDLISQTISFVKSSLKNAESGHDWWHIERVWKNARLIAQSENVNLVVVELAALLHDIADSKFHDGDEEIGPETAGKFLRSIGVEAETITHVQQIIRHMSFKASFGERLFSSKEMEVVQDADRLDAIGAIGIARAFTYGGYKNRELYDPGMPPNLDMTREQYKHNAAPTINHFYEKLLLLKDKMNTPAGRKIAASRHQFMLTYLEQFYAEWNGEV
ncbi:HD domain-containing protein [Hufsiella ginkgonis]|uniref:HD domain-containing protein n=1 Tax=Hufsiella ginkgonis TaxID=2695274 RepID=A0A7K1XVA6_9SPHI|nr:HD domain-containing protein [Hufsiella ginkgonis]MXV14699.1 HD domain-containing protein [Hufsiella ginkgonis]